MKASCFLCTTTADVRCFVKRAKADGGRQLDGIPTAILLVVAEGDMSLVI